MALIKKLERVTMDRNSVHGYVAATYTVFQNDAGEKVLQIDTYGSPQRQIPGKKSQTLQFGPKALAQLREILGEV